MVAARHLAVERHVRGTAQQRGRVGEQGRVRRVRRVEVADDVARGRALRPRHAQRVRGEAQPLDVTRVRVGQRPQDADAAVQHEPRRAHAGEQRDLRVPLLDRQGRAAAQGPHAVGTLLDHLLRGRQRDAAARPLGRLPEDADLPQQLQRLVRGAVVEGRLRTDVRQLCAALYRGAAHVDVDRRALARRGRSSTAAPASPGRAAGSRRPPTAAAGAAACGRPGRTGSRRGRAPRRRERRPATPTRRRRRSRTAPGTRRRGARCGPPGPGPSSPRGRW